jgi:hypothetical protein
VVSDYDPRYFATAEAKRSRNGKAIISGLATASLRPKNACRNTVTENIVPQPNSSPARNDMFFLLLFLRDK